MSRLSDALPTPPGYGPPLPWGVVRPKYMVEDWPEWERDYTKHLPEIARDIGFETNYRLMIDFLDTYVLIANGIGGERLIDRELRNVARMVDNLEELVAISPFPNFNTSDDDFVDSLHHKLNEAKYSENRQLKLDVIERMAHAGHQTEPLVPRACGLHIRIRRATSRRQLEDINYVVRKSEELTSWVLNCLAREELE